MGETGSEAAGARATLRWSALAYALIPALGAALWLVIGDDDPLRNRVPVNLFPLLEIGVFALAIRAGLRWGFVARGLTRAEAVALAVLVSAYLWGVIAAAPEPVAAVERMVMRLPHLGLGIAVAYLIGAGGRARDAAAAIAAQPLVHLPLLAVLYLVYAGDPEMNWLGGPVGFWHVRIWGMVLAGAFAAAFGLYAGAARPNHVAAGVALTLLAALLFWSGSRAGAVGLAGALALGAALFPRRVLRALPLAVACIVIGAGLSLLVPVPIRDYGLLSSLGETAALAQSPEAGSAGRVAIWTETLRLIAERPLLGWGHDQFRYLYSGEVLAAIQPHNAILNFVFDFGLIGGGALTFVLLSLWWRGLRRLRAAPSPGGLGALMALNSMAVIGLFDGSFYHPEPLMIIALSYGVLLGAKPVPRRL